MAGIIHSALLLTYYSLKSVWSPEFAVTPVFSTFWMSNGVEGGQGLAGPVWTREACRGVPRIRWSTKLNDLVQHLNIAMG